MTRYPGGKSGSGVWQRIINLQPPHDVYCEPFLGSGAVMRRKLPARINIGVDLDPAVVTRSADIVAAVGVAGEGGGRPQFDFVSGDGISYLQERRWGPTDMVYVDPPYPRRTRSCPRRMYRCELEDADHERLLDVLVVLPCRVQVSGYYCDMYGFALRGWDRIDYDVVVRSGAVRRECLWYNYPKPAELHDSRFLGDSYRERERIRKRQRRWAVRLAGMESQERQALMWALRQYR